MGLYAPIRRIGTKIPSLYTYKRYIGTSVALHLYFFRVFAYQSELDEINHVVIGLSNSIQSFLVNRIAQFRTQNLCIDPLTHYL